jgi:hypothetical protein
VFARVRIERFEIFGLVLTAGRETFTVTYGEILTAERSATGGELVLHVRTSDPIRVRCRRGSRPATENELRGRGVRVVDEYGAMITPSLEAFEAELVREPERLRQSSDNA